jgi:CRISPR system Cascade subunit CasE
MSEKLHLIHLRPNLSRLVPWAHRQGLVPDSGQGDLGYALHAALMAAFGEYAPKPFSLRAGQGLLGYTQNADGMRSAAAMASPEVADMLGLDQTDQSPGLLIREYPTNWKVGQLLSFEVRVRPTVRKDGKDERDAFLSAIDRAGDKPVSREAVYRDWIKNRFGGAAELYELGMSEFGFSTVLRRSAPGADGGRAKHRFEGPDATIKGVLQVREPDAFAALVARGIGRHRAFGFGMLLLKPAVADWG